MTEPTLQEMAQVVGKWCGWPPGTLVWRYEMVVWYDPNPRELDRVTRSLNACRKFELELEWRRLGYEYLHQLRSQLYGAGFVEIPPGDGLRIRMASPEMLLRAAYHTIMEAAEADKQDLLPVNTSQEEIQPKGDNATGQRSVKIKAT